jgi:serine protease Do
VEGLGFAIPISSAKPVIDELIMRGYVKGRPAIGISGESVTDSEARFLGVPQGLRVTKIHPDCDAAKQGMRLDDIITHINDEEIYTVGDINLIKNDFQAGDTLTATVYRPSDRTTVNITFALMEFSEVNG